MNLEKYLVAMIRFLRAPPLESKLSMEENSLLRSRMLNGVAFKCIIAICSFVTSVSVAFISSLRSLTCFSAECNYCWRLVEWVCNTWHCWRNHADAHAWLESNRLQYPRRPRSPSPTYLIKLGSVRNVGWQPTSGSFGYNPPSSHKSTLVSPRDCLTDAGWDAFSSFFFVGANSIGRRKLTLVDLTDEGAGDSLEETWWKVTMGKKNR